MDLKSYSLEDIDNAASSLNRQKAKAKNEKLDVILSQLHKFRRELYLRRDKTYRPVQDMASADAIKTDKAIKYMKSINRVLARV